MNYVIALPPLRERSKTFMNSVTDFMEQLRGHGKTSAAMIPTPDAMEYSSSNAGR